MEAAVITAVGIDVSKSKSTVAVRRPGGEIVLRPFDVRHTNSDLKKLTSTLKKLGGDIRIVMEHTSTYWRPIALTLKEAGFFVSVVNAMLIHDFSDNTIRKLKTDRADALKIANYALAFWDTLPPFNSEEETRLLLKMQSRATERITATATALRNGLIALADQTFPGVNIAFDPNTKNANGHEKWVDFFLRYWHKDCVCQYSMETFTESYRSWCKRKNYKFRTDTAHKIYLLAQEGVATLPRCESTKMLITQACKSLNAVCEAKQSTQLEPCCRLIKVAGCFTAPCNNFLLIFLFSLLTLVSRFASVLANMLTTDAVNQINAIQNSVDEVKVPVSAETQALTAAFDQITSKASEIQGRGIYGDEAMIAAAGEFSTYFTDADAITTMMDTLADYAMGMSGGGALDSTALVDYATGLGKMMSGAYDAMTKKGFEVTDVQKAIIEGTATQAQITQELGAEYANISSDMQAAATISEIIEESWAGLYENMSNTPEGKIIQMTNAWGDMEEMIGGRLYPCVLLFVDAVNSNWPTIETVVQGITGGLQIMLTVLSWIAQGALTVADVVANNWSWISPIIGGVTAALMAYYGWQLAVKAAEAISAGVKIALAVASYAHAAATGAEVTATAAQYGLNTAFLASPVTWWLWESSPL